MFSLNSNLMAFTKALHTHLFHSIYPIINNICLSQKTLSNLRAENSCHIQLYIKFLGFGWFSVKVSAY